MWGWSREYQEGWRDLAVKHLFRLVHQEHVLASKPCTVSTSIQFHHVGTSELSLIDSRTTDVLLRPYVILHKKLRDPTVYHATAIVGLDFQVGTC